jgi:hypothetical protein
MKKIFFSILPLFLAMSVFAQHSVNPNAKIAADKMIKMFNLDEQQAATALEIQERRYKNLAEIAVLENTDKDLYRHKYKAIQQSTDASLRRMLNKDQMVIYNQKKLELRNQRAAKSAELKQQGLSMEEIENALFELEKN